jgi:hypothetical protein
MYGSYFLLFDLAECASRHGVSGRVSKPPSKLQHSPCAFGYHFDSWKVIQADAARLLTVHVTRSFDFARRFRHLEPVENLKRRAPLRTLRNVSYRIGGTTLRNDDNFVIVLEICAEGA